MKNYTYLDYKSRRKYICVENELWINFHSEQQYRSSAFRMSTIHMDSSDLGPMDDGLQDLGLPVPVQTFLWGQIAPFIRPKLGKLHEATCQVSSNKSGAVILLYKYLITPIF